MQEAASAAQRCPWCLADESYRRYHDVEWGVPVCLPSAGESAQPLFERLALEGMQAGLSWLTVLRKREQMREAFHGFEPERLAKATPSDIERWLRNPGVIRHAGKLRALVGNAQAFLRIDDPAAALWSFVDGCPVQNRWAEMADVPSSTPASLAMSRWLKAQGFKFVGATICYAFMQSVGMVNDHLTGCHRHAQLASASPQGEAAGVNEP